MSDRTIVYDATVNFFYRRAALHKEFVSKIVTAHRAGKIVSAMDLRRWLRRDQSIKLLFRHRKKVALPAALVESLEIANTYRWPVPNIETVDQLCDVLCLSSPRVLDWLTLPHRRRDTKVDHYRRIARRKRDGTVRWIEQPARTLKHVQRVIATELLPLIPLHDAAHGFRRGRDAYQCAQLHVGRSFVMRMDLQNFFGSIHFGRVRALFELAGYARDIANPLAQLCTAAGIGDSDLPATLQRSRLPQGAPTSPGLANAVAFRLDRRIAGLCQSADVVYTRYADDLIFSSNHFSLTHAKRFATTVAVIAMEEGFDVNYRKTYFARSGNRQQVLGFTVNQKCNTPRREYETLKAILHRCKRDGPESQNRDQHPRFQESLRGRIAHVTRANPSRGEKLMRVYDQVAW